MNKGQNTEGQTTQGISQWDSVLFVLQYLERHRLSFSIFVIIIFIMVEKTMFFHTDIAPLVWKCGCGNPGCSCHKAAFSSSSNLAAPKCSLSHHLSLKWLHYHVYNHTVKPERHKILWNCDVLWGKVASCCLAVEFCYSHKAPQWPINCNCSLNLPQHHPCQSRHPGWRPSSFSKGLKSTPAISAPFQWTLSLKDLACAC